MGCGASKDTVVSKTNKPEEPIKEKHNTVTINDTKATSDANPKDHKKEINENTEPLNDKKDTNESKEIPAVLISSVKTDSTDKPKENVIKEQKPLTNNEPKNESPIDKEEIFIISPTAKHTATIICIHEFSSTIL